jgi:hypothetical protein
VDLGIELHHEHDGDRAWCDDRCEGAPPLKPLLALLARVLRSTPPPFGAGTWCADSEFRDSGKEQDFAFCSIEFVLTCFVNLLLASTSPLASCRLEVEPVLHARIPILRLKELDTGFKVDVGRWDPIFVTQQVRPSHKQALCKHSLDPTFCYPRAGIVGALLAV